MSHEREVVKTPEIALPEKCLSLPSENQQGLRQILELIKRTNREVGQREPRTLQELNAVLPQIHEQAQKIMTASRGFGESKLNEIADFGRGFAILEGRGEAFSAAGNFALGAFEKGKWDDWLYNYQDWNVPKVAAWAAAWETIKDLLGFKENPFRPWLELFRLGARRFSDYKKQSNSLG